MTLVFSLYRRPHQQEVAPVACGLHIGEDAGDAGIDVRLEGTPRVADRREEGVPPRHICQSPAFSDTIVRGLAAFNWLDSLT